MKSVCRLAHRRQSLATGCTAHALYALTGDDLFLELEQECNAYRLHILAFNRGLMLWPLWVAGLESKPIPAGLWDEFVEIANGVHAVIAVGQLNHSIAVQLESKWEGGVWVSDSLKDGPEWFDRKGFLESPYSKALLAHALVPSDLNEHKFDP